MARFAVPAKGKLTRTMWKPILSYLRNQKPSIGNGAAEDRMLAAVEQERLPEHIAIIMDGNGRWATQRGLPRVAGHRAGVETLKTIAEACGRLGVPVLTVYAFSTENWDRPRDEVEFLMNLLDESLQHEVETLHDKGVRIRAVGSRDGLPDSVLAGIDRAVALTSGNDRLTLNVALNYGGRAEIVAAAARMAKDAVAGSLDPAEIDEACFASHLYTSGLPDPDLMIRTGGEHRLSNFLLWQLAYAELWVTPVFWPDFRRYHLLEAILDYQGRQRRFGRV